MQFDVILYAYIYIVSIWLNRDSGLLTKADLCRSFGHAC